MIPCSQIEVDLFSCNDSAVVAVIRDPASGWVTADDVTGRPVAEAIAGFVFRSLCTFGMASEVRLNAGPLLTAEDSDAIKSR